MARQKTEESKNKYLVKHPGGPDHIVEADDKTQAWIKYKEWCVIFSSAHEPEIILVDDDGQS